MENEKIEMNVERFMNLMEDKEMSDKCSDELDELLDILFENTKCTHSTSYLHAINYCRALESLYLYMFLENGFNN